MTSVTPNTNNLKTFAEMQGPFAVFTDVKTASQTPPPPPKGNVNLERVPEQDTVTVFGKKIKKKTFGIGMALTAAATITGAFYAAKRGKVINTGKEAGFFSNLGEGLKSIFTKEGKHKYELAQNAAQSTTSAAGKIEEAAVQNTQPAPVEKSEKSLPDKVKDAVTEPEKEPKPVRKKKKEKRKSEPKTKPHVPPTPPTPPVPPVEPNPPAVKDLFESNFERVDRVDYELMAMKRKEEANLNKPKKGFLRRISGIFGKKQTPAPVDPPVVPAANKGANEPNFARLDTYDPELNRVDGTKYIEEKKSGGFFSFLKKNSKGPDINMGTNPPKPAQPKQIEAKIEESFLHSPFSSDELLIKPSGIESGLNNKKDLPDTIHVKKLQPYEFEEMPPDMNRFNTASDKNIPYSDFREMAPDRIGILNAQTEPSAHFYFDKVDEYEATYITGTDGKSYKAPKKSLFAKLAGIFKGNKA